MPGLDKQMKQDEKAVHQRMDGRAVEGARLESAYTSKAYRGFESHSIRQLFVANWSWG